MLGHTTRRGSLSYRSFQRTGFRSPCEPACCASMLGRWDQGEVRCQEGRFDITTDYPVATSPRFCISKTLEWETNYEDADCHWDRGGIGTGGGRFRRRGHRFHSDARGCVRGHPRLLDQRRGERVSRVRAPGCRVGLPEGHHGDFLEPGWNAGSGGCCWSRGCYRSSWAGWCQGCGWACWSRWVDRCHRRRGACRSGGSNRADRRYRTGGSCRSDWAGGGHR